MLMINLKDAKARFSCLVDEAGKSRFITVTRHGKPVAVAVSIGAAEIARKAIVQKAQKRVGLPAYLRTFPGGAFERNRSPPVDVEVATPDEAIKSASTAGRSPGRLKP